MIILVLLGKNKWNTERLREREKQDWNTVVCYTTLRFPPPRLYTCGTQTFSLCILQSTGLNLRRLGSHRRLSTLFVLCYHQHEEMTF